MPPLWFVFGWWMVRSRRELVRTATSGFVEETLYCVDRHVAALEGPVDVEGAVGLVARVEREPEQSPLTAVADHVRDVEEGGRQQDAVLDDPDPAGLLDHEQAAAAVPGARDEIGCHEARDDRPQDDGSRRARAGRPERDERDDEGR